MAFSRWRLSSTAGILLAAFCLGTAPAASAHIEGQYGQRGYIWLQYYWNGTIWVTSTDCNNRELGAYDRILSSTAGKPEFANRWSDGLVLVQKRCDGVVGTQIDIKIIYEDVVASWWGYNDSDRAPSSWCAMWDVPHPCGSHPSRVHIKLSSWQNHGDMWRERLIMHETGHSLGIAHHCADDSIMNTPAGNGPACTEANWTDVMVWKAHDRDAHVNVYPNWKGP